MSRIRTNQITNQSADGAPTVQNGLVISGVTTSTTFSGSGASLTSLPAANLTGTLPAISGANLTSLPAQATIANNADNRVITGGSGVNLNGEAGLTYNGLQLNISNTVPELFLTDTNSNNSYGRVRGNGGNLILSADVNNATGGLRIVNFEIGGSEKARILSTGGVGVGTDTPEINGGSGGGGLHLHGPATDNVRIKFTTPTKSNPGSSIGYFGLNRFGIDTYDGIEMRDVTRSYATIFKIDQNGYMTTNQPYGYVRFNTHNDNGGEQRQTNVNTHTVQNGMSHSGGRLTVPAAGKYYIGIHGNILDNGSAAQYLYINGSKSNGWNWQQNDTVSYWKSSMVGGVIALNANDYLDVYVTGKQDNASWNMFTVYMLG